MSSPSVADWALVERVAKYLKHRPAVECVYRWQSSCEAIDAYSDSDWAGDKLTRRSTSGGMVCWGRSVLKSWSTRQTVVARSSGEAEFYALSKSASEALGVRSIAQDFGWDLSLIISLDSSAAKAMASRVGLGKTRHIDVCYLWIQDLTKKSWVKLRKIPGDKNPSDVLTKPKTGKETQELLDCVSLSLDGLN